MSALRIPSLHWLGVLLLGLSACSSQSPEPQKQSSVKSTSVPDSETKVAPVAKSERLWDGKALLVHYMPWYETPQGRGKWGGALDRT